MKTIIDALSILFALILQNFSTRLLNENLFNKINNKKFKVVFFKFIFCFNTKVELRNFLGYKLC